MELSNIWEVWIGPLIADPEVRLQMRDVIQVRALRTGFHRLYSGKVEGQPQTGLLFPFVLDFASHTTATVITCLDSRR